MAKGTIGRTGAGWTTLLVVMAAASGASVWAQAGAGGTAASPAPASPAGDTAAGAEGKPVIVTGTVPDEATRAAVLAQMRAASRIAVRGHRALAPAQAAVVGTVQLRAEMAQVERGVPPTVARVGQGQHMPLGALGQPAEHLFNPCVQIVGYLLQGQCRCLPHHGLQGGQWLRKDGFRQAEGGQQLAGGLFAHARREQQPHPGGQLLPLHRRYGLTKRSPTFTPSVICSTRA